LIIFQIKLFFDVYNKINHTNTLEYIQLTQKDNYILKFIELDINEQIIYNYEMESICTTACGTSLSNNSSSKIYCSLIITNFSNIYSCNCKLPSFNSGRNCIDYHNKNTIIKKETIQNNIYDTPLDPIIIKIVQSMEIPSYKNYRNNMCCSSQLIGFNSFLKIINILCSTN